MTYSISDHNTVQVLEVQSLFNETDNKEILRDVQSRIEKGLNKFIVDLSKLDFMNSVGLNFMISILTQSQQSGGNLTVVNANKQVVSLLEMTKLTAFFDLKPSVKDALEHSQKN